MENNKPIKLCIIATVPLSIISFYGEQIAYLTDKGYEVTVITSPDSELTGRISNKARLVLIPMTRTISPWRDLIAFIKVFCCIRKGSFDIVQYSSVKAALLGSLSSWLCRVPVRLYLMWGLYFTGQDGLKRDFLKYFDKMVCFFSTAVSPDSHGNMQLAVEEKLCPLSKISVVGKGSANGVDLSRFDPQRLKEKGIAVRKSLKIPPDAVIVGFVGRLRRDKGINELIQAFLDLHEKYPRLYLLLVGANEYKNGEYDLLINSTLAQQKRIIFVGHQDSPEDYLSAMDIFVLPSYREGFGIANIEASAMALPVISTDINGPRDAVLNGQTGILVPAKTINPLREAIETLYTNTNLRLKMGRTGKEWAKNFEQRLMWQLIFTHRQALLQNRPRRFIQM